MNRKLGKMIGLSLLMLTIEPALSYPTKVGFDCKQEQHGLFAATREGKNSILQLYLDNKCPLDIHDARGFSLYDIASLTGQKETIDWLISNNLAKEGQHSSAFYKLLQTGLRFLNHDAGVVDGRMNTATADGIKSFQKFIHQNPTGRPNIAWLPVFNHHLTKKMQSKLNELGFKAGGIDGIIGSGTRSAMQAFRQERKMPRGEYPYIDDQLIYQLMMAENEANKKAIARREAEQAARQIAQQAAQRQEEARRRAEAQRRATEKRQLAEAAAAKAEAERLAAEQRRQAEISAQRQADDAATRALQAKIAQQQAEANQKSVQQAAAERIARNQQEADAAAARVEQIKTQQLTAQQAEQQALEEEKRRLAQIEKEKEAARKREAELIAARARKAAEEARKAEELARQEAEKAAKEAEKARSEAQTAFREVEKGKPIFALNTSKNNTPLPVESEQKTIVQVQRTRTPGFQKVAGRLQLHGKGSQLISCSLGGADIDVGWCRQYYPRGGGRKCQAVISNTGVVVSLTCK